MKTFEEALTILAIPIEKSEGKEMPLELVNQTDVARTVMGCEDARAYLQFVVASFTNGEPDNLILSVACTAFVAGIRVGQEMEKP